MNGTIRILKTAAFIGCFIRKEDDYMLYYQLPIKTEKHFLKRETKVMAFEYCHLTFPNSRIWKLKC